MRRRLVPLALGVSALLGAACTSAKGSSLMPTTSPASGVAGESGLPVALTDLMATGETRQWITTGDDLIEVWVCHVPVDSTASIYGGMTLRLDLTARGVTDVIRSLVPQYYATISDGLYRPVFRAGGEVNMTVDQSPQDCLDAALVGAGADAQGVFAVADAEHGSNSPGGFGHVGSECLEPPCPAGVTGRSAYIGASDFHPDWGAQAPLDLVEHELGHMLGWAHTGVAGGGAYLSALDVMSNSASPRDTDPEARDAPGTLALNRLLAGWLPVADVWPAPAGGGSVTLASSTGNTGTRLAVVGLTGNEFLMIELLTTDGYNAHLPADGIAVHRVTVAGGEVDEADPLVGETPFADLLAVGESFDTDGWRITVADGWVVTISPIG